MVCSADLRALDEYAVDNLREVLIVLEIPYLFPEKITESDCLASCLELKFTVCIHSPFALPYSISYLLHSCEGIIIKRQRIESA